MSEKKPPQHTLDLRGLKCPLPAIKTQKALQAMQVNETISIFTTDPLAMIDVPHAVLQSGGLITSSTDCTNHYVFEAIKQATTNS